LCDAIAEIEEWNIERDPPSLASASLSCSQSVLEYLATNNIFLIPLDENGQWFRYHNLFAETVQARLQETQPNLIPELHRWAGRWYAANGFTEQAITHALAAQDTEMAADLIEAAANQLWAQGHLSVLLGWLSVLPESVLLNRLNLCLLHAWLLFLHDRITFVGRLLKPPMASNPPLTSHFFCR
jgi:LuxR family maltose regulon positive regulatory protein